MRWTRLPQAGAQPVARSSHSITIIGDTLYLLGGEHDPRVPVGSDIYAYSFADGQWRVLEAKGEPPSPRVAHSAAAVGSTIYIFGGRSGQAMGEGASNDLFSFHTPTATWTRLTPNGPPPPLRSYHTMAAVGNRLYVFGGCGEAGRLNDLHMYDTETNAWTALAAPSEEKVPGRGGSCLVPAAGDAGQGLCVVAGFCGRELDDMHLYSIPDNAWCGSGCPSCAPPDHHDHHTASSPPGSTSAHAGKLSARSVFGAARHVCERSTCAHAGALLVYGGEVEASDKGHDGAGDFCASLMEYDGGCWRSLEAGGESPGPRGWFASATAPDGRLVVHGGLDANNERLADMFALDVHA